MNLIEVKDLSVNYEQVEALKHVDFKVAKKEFIGIIGPNGGGKTTMVKALLGLVEPSGGHIRIDTSVTLGYVPQLTTFDRAFPISVEDVILSGHLSKKIRLFQKYSHHEREHASQVMERLGILNLAKRQIGNLSGGQMQRVLIARALMNHPTVLILDEPTAGVDEKSKKDIYGMLEDLNHEMTILMITHNTEEVMNLLDRVIYINKTGHIHDLNKLREDEKDCPIDWFVQGEHIQKELLKREGLLR